LFVSNTPLNPLFPEGTPALTYKKRGRGGVTRQQMFRLLQYTQNTLEIPFKKINCYNILIARYRNSTSSFTVNGEGDRSFLVYYRKDKNFPFKRVLKANIIMRCT